MRLAVSWFRRAAEAGDVWAQGELARIYVWGLDGLRASPKKALLWARRVVDDIEKSKREVADVVGPKRDAVGEAYHALGWCEEDGKGTPRDDEAAFRHYRLAAEAGNSCAMDDLGQAYEAGRGVPKDLRAARRWYVRAARLGDPHAKRWLRGKSRIPR